MILLYKHLWIVLSVKEWEDSIIGFCTREGFEVSNIEYSSSDLKDSKCPVWYPLSLGLKQYFPNKEKAVSGEEFFSKLKKFLNEKQISYHFILLYDANSGMINSIGTNLSFEKDLPKEEKEEKEEVLEELEVIEDNTDILHS